MSPHQLQAGNVEKVEKKLVETKDIFFSQKEQRREFFMKVTTFQKCPWKSFFESFAKKKKTGNALVNWWLWTF